MTATAAEVTEDPPGATIRHALALVSQPVVFDLVENPQWAHLVVAHASSEINRGRCTQTNAPDAPAIANGFPCWQLLQQLQYLDTEDSLREVVRLYDGLADQPGTSLLWQAISESQHQHLALQLMETKLEQPGFAASRVR